jgi:hypothetical protein
MGIGIPPQVVANLGHIAFYGAMCRGFMAFLPVG